MYRLRSKAAMLFALPLFSLTTTFAAPSLAQSASQADVIAKIKEEGLNRSQVMQTLSYLTDVIGPRLTASPNMKRANEWTKTKMTEWGLQNAHLEAWGPFGRGWSLERFSAQVTSPQNIPLIAYPKAWSPGFKAPHVGEVVFVDANTEEELEKYKGKLKGAIVLNGTVRPVNAHFEPLGVRYTDEELKNMESGAPRRPRNGAPGVAGGPQGGPNAMSSFQARAAFAARKAQFFQTEGVAMLVDSSPRGDGGTLFVQSATVPQAVPIAPPTPPVSTATAPAGTPTAPGAGARARGQATQGARRVSPWDKDAPKIIPQMVMAVEHYNRLARMLQQGERLKMTIDMSVKFYDQDLMSYNTVAEIPGSDLKDQIVMLGAHMDSWHSGTGATDNAAGCAVAMEAVRILKALKLQPRRTIRVALWSGEEEGLFGSRAYVADHFGSLPPRTGAGFGGGGFGGARALDLTGLNKKPEYDKISGYFNLDNGTGKIRGVYLQGNEAVGPIFKEWLEPFKEMGAATVTINNTGSTDHVSFDGIGIPGFQFIQDVIEYDTRTHHSNQDVYDRIQADDMKQASIIMAAFIYNTAMRDEMLPRKASTKTTASTN